MRVLAMIPARLGSQRLRQKNLQTLRGAPLIAHAVRKCLAAGVFDEVWVNSEAPEIGTVAEAEGARFHRRPLPLADDAATSEQFVAEFLERHECDAVVQVHSIAPLLTVAELRGFVARLHAAECDVLLSVTRDPLEHLYRGQPVNFTFAEKTNSQDLEPVERIAWSVTGWRRDTYLEACRNGRCATYAGRIATWPVGRLAGHVIKTAEDLAMAEALWEVAHGWAKPG
ncbi:NTP transferase domain-containing protein [Roseomonas sp. OT10]|uniref:acylneuraminate cytidylyltransferase family protein n=1 Tax=Roseomonas cutis TaxID=2897332 RepID=UPI001E4EDC49|nr:NTP transferase domain-containing protein [Roseomonas sp. OT10]UFN50303.1 NTP transferase domain-containing protein [Roseomonas sp. OT10]